MKKYSNTWFRDGFGWKRLEVCIDENGLILEVRIDGEKKLLPSRIIIPIKEDISPDVLELP